MHRFRKKSDVKRNQVQDFGFGAAPPPSSSSSPPQLTLGGLQYQHQQDSGSGSSGLSNSELHLDFLPANDFRTSLILPDLSRRFSLLRTPEGDPVTFDDLRSKFAEQRARGAENTISEEEEDMLLETLGKLRGRHSGSSAADKSKESVSVASDGGNTEESGSTSSATVKLTGGGKGSVSSSASGSTTGRSKRYSNNLFGSGRLRDYTYLRTVSSSRNSGGGGSSKAASIAASEESSNNPRLGNTSSFTDSVASSSSPPAGSTTDESVLSMSTSTNDQGSVRSTSSSANEAISAAEYRLQKSLGPAGLKRASLALENVIKEIEYEEMEEEIVMPRSTPIPRNYPDHQPQNGQYQQRNLGEDFARDSTASMLSSVIEAGMAISSDKPHDDVDESGAQRGPSPVPLGHVPGYIPGMPRPMTPRDFDRSFAEEQRSHSTTPRATSPMHHGSFTLSEAGSAAASISGILRRESISNRQSPRPTTPLFLQRSPHGGHGSSISSSISNSPASGRYTPVDDPGRTRLATDLSSSTNSGGTSYDFDASLSSSVLGGRRRPASPLANPPMHAISAVSSSPVRTPSRPTTPSNIIWGYRPDTSPSPQSGGQGRHSRDNSWASEGDSDAYMAGETDDDVYPGTGIAGSPSPASGGSKPVRAPPRSDSPGPEKGQLSRSWTFKASQAANGGRPLSPTNGEVAQHQVSPSQRSNHRSLTPTQNAPRSPGSPTFGATDSGSPRSARRASRQNGYASPFNLGPLPALTLNPRANNSTSSLESTGSSFHSWEGEKDKVLNLFNDAEVQPAWHAISTSSSSPKSSTTSGANGATPSTARTSPDEDWDPEDMVRSYAGLKKGDFAMIHEKLVTVAKTTEHRGSAMRKRRPSTSQSNYSVRDNRVASPPPPASPTINVHASAREQQQLHILNTCIDQPLAAPVMALSNSSSSFDRPNRNLARVLFGQEDDTNDTDSQANGTPPTSIPDSTEPSNLTALQSAFSEHLDSPPRPKPQPISPHTHDVFSQPSPASSLTRNLSSARIPPQTPQERAALELEVQQKVEAATLALRKRPSQEGLAHSPSLSRTKRIDPSQISKPLLVSSSTSVDTIALKTPILSASNGSGPSKIGSRFKKLRGSLRAKNVLAIDEVATPTSEAKTSPNSQSATYDPEKLKSPGPPSIASATDTGRFKVNVPSPPASAGPGLKGFMARFRTKRTTDVPHSSSSSISSDHHPSSHLPTSPLSSPLAQQRQFSNSSGLSRAPSQSTASATETGNTPTTARPEQYRTQFSSPVPSTSQSLPTTSEASESDDNNALHQLFAAATNLGIDQAALNDLLKRSGSQTARTALNPGQASTGSRGNGQANPHGQHLTVPPIQHPNLSSSSGSDYTATPGMFNSSPVSDLSVGNNFSYNEEAPTEDSVTKAPTKRVEHLRQPRDVNTDSNPIVRRTLIFADPRQSTVDPLKRNRSRRRASVQSASNRSIHDRVPTPPPSKTPQSKRFSHEASPPVPQLPHALGGPSDSQLSVPTGQLEKSHSAAYDSLYELYGDSRSTSMMVDSNHPDFGRGDAHLNSETATGVEVIQLANGDIIWNVVNGLRDEDDESLYTGRNSVGSEYSTQEGGGSMQLFVKEHTRASSKGSNASFLSRKKGAAGKSRPETKVLYGSPEQIGRLIESVSQGMDAGSFNFSPTYGTSRGHTGGHHGQGHSATSSLSTNDWAINEIDNILTSINRP